MIDTEKTYISNLQLLHNNYITKFKDCELLPEAMRSYHNELFENISPIIEFHETKLLPTFIEAQYDIIKLCETFVSFIKVILSH